MRKGEVEVKKSLLEWKMENDFWKKKLKKWARVVKVYNRTNS